MSLEVDGLGGFEARIYEYVDRMNVVRFDHQGTSSDFVKVRGPRP